MWGRNADTAQCHRGFVVVDGETSKVDGETALLDGLVVRGQTERKRLMQEVGLRAISVMRRGVNCRALEEVPVLAADVVGEAGEGRDGGLVLAHVGCMRRCSGRGRW